MQAQVVEKVLGYMLADCLLQSLVQDPKIKIWCTEFNNSITPHRLINVFGHGPFVIMTCTHKISLAENAYSQPSPGQI